MKTAVFGGWLATEPLERSMAKPTSNESNLVLLESLIRNWEDETIEFKEASNDFDTDKIGRYVSALSNEANLSDEPSAWLVFGVRNKTR